MIEIKKESEIERDKERHRERVNKLSEEKEEGKCIKSEPER